MAITKESSYAWKFTIAILIFEGAAITSGLLASANVWLLVPYIAWVSFAIMLNFCIWNLNH
jgi:tryptophan-rich sensory protein